MQTVHFHLQFSNYLCIVCNCQLGCSICCQRLWSAYFYVSWGYCLCVSQQNPCTKIITPGLIKLNMTYSILMSMCIYLDGGTWAWEGELSGSKGIPGKECSLFMGHLGQGENFSMYALKVQGKIASLHHQRPPRRGKIIWVSEITKEKINRLLNKFQLVHCLILEAHDMGSVHWFSTCWNRSCR